MQQFLPFVVVGRPPAHIDLRVDRRTAAENVALRYVMSAAVQMLLWNCLMIGHELAALDHLEDARGHVEKRMAMGMARLEQEHARVFLRHEARRDDAA